MTFPPVAVSIAEKHATTEALDNFFCTLYRSLILRSTSLGDRECTFASIGFVKASLRRSDHDIGALVTVASGGQSNVFAQRLEIALATVPRKLLSLSSNSENEHIISVDF
jgi:hypothetical protein